VLFQTGGMGLHLPRFLTADWRYLAMLSLWWGHQRENRMELEFLNPPQFAEEGSLEEFISEHYWGYSAQRDGGAVEYEVQHPKWRIWSAKNVALCCDAKALYGTDFAHALAAPFASAFVAEGLPVEVSWGRRLSTGTPPR
jgi:hypothetical protein